MSPGTDWQEEGVYTLESHLDPWRPLSRAKAHVTSISIVVIRETGPRIGGYALGITHLESLAVGPPSRRARRGSGLRFQRCPGF